MTKTKTGTKDSKRRKTALKSVAKKTPKTKQAAIPAEQLLQFYKDMLLIRRFEEKSGQLYGMGLIGGFCHLYIGQEAVVTGIQAALTDIDTVITAYRDHGHMLACGMDPKGVMAELTGRADGYSKGKGGSMHMFSRDKKFYGGHGIVGATAPLGTGLAFAHKYREDGGITACYYGDGAANQGQVYESYNMAALWKLPVLYVIENNKYAMGTSQERSAAGELYKRGEGWGIPGKKIDGMDVTVVYREAQEAVDFVRGGGGPFILEVETYRYRGHSMSDPAKYRTKEEVQSVRDERDPIQTVRNMLVADKTYSEDDLKEVEKEIKQIVGEAAEFAQQSPEPDPSELWTDIVL